MIPFGSEVKFLDGKLGTVIENEYFPDNYYVIRSYDQITGERHNWIVHEDKVELIKENKPKPKLTLVR